MKYFTALVAVVLLIIFISPIVEAEQTNLKIRILPIDCLFEVIDIGTQQLLYLTPETCPIEEVPTPPKETPSSQETSNPITIRRSNYISDYYQENGVQLTNQNNIKPKVESAIEHKDVFDLIKSTKDIEIIVIILLAVLLSLVTAKWIFKKRKF